MLPLQQHPAVVFDDWAISCPRLLAAATALTHDILREHGARVRPGATIALSIPRSIALPLTMLAIQLLQAIYVPINEEEEAESRIVSVLQTSAATLVVSVEGLPIVERLRRATHACADGSLSDPDSSVKSPAPSIFFLPSVHVQGKQLVFSDGKVEADENPPSAESLRAGLDSLRAAQIACCGSGVADYSSAALLAAPIDGDGRDRFVSYEAAYLISTSGSTGPPKLVTLTHRALIAHVMSLALVSPSRGPPTPAYFPTNLITPSDRVLQLSFVSFDMHASKLYGSLMLGSCVVMFPPKCQLDFDYMARRVLARHRPTVSWIVPTNTYALLEAIDAMPVEDGFVSRAPCQSDATRSLDALAHLRFLLIGEAFPTELLTRLRQRYPKTHCCNTYGPAESATGPVFHECTREDLAPFNRGSGGYVPIGLPLAGWCALLLRIPGRTMKGSGT